MGNKNSRGNASSHNHNLVTNNKNTIENTKWKLNLLRQAKLDLLNNMNFENSLVNRNNLANQIAENRDQNWKNHKNIWVPEGDIIIRTNPDISVNIDLDSYGMKWEYERLINEINNLRANGGSDQAIKEKEKKLRELDSMLAERCILDNWGSIEFKSTDVFESQRNAKDESKEAYNELNKLDAYKWKIELISKKKNDVDFYVIKRTEEQIEEIKQKYEELLKNNEKNKDDEKKDDEKKHDEKKDDEKKDDEKKDDEKKDDEKKDDEKKDDEKDKELEELRKQNEEQKKRIKELEEKLNGNNINIKIESESIEDEIDNTDEWENETSENVNNDIDSEETLDENPNYISRISVESLIYWIRWTEWYPKWTIKIKEETINVEEFEFYEEFKQEYIEAKWDATRLSILDKEFAEMVILFSPKWADYKDRYCIKLSESELKSGLFVSDERLARYWISTKVSEYFEKIVEKEVIRERKIVQRIETEIKELNVIITELTEKLNWKENDSETILEEIRKKRILLAKLIKRQRVILKSLNWPQKTVTKIVDDSEKPEWEVLYEDFTWKNWEILISYCKNNKIKRVDWKDIDPYGDVINGHEFIDSEWRILRLILLEWDSSVDYWTEPKFRLEYTWKKQIEKIEKNDKNRIVVEKFDDSDGWAWFAKYCEENWIKRKDGKKISQKWGMDTSAIYVDKDWKELKLEWIKWANQHDDAWSHTEYELVYYEESWDVSELETQLIAIIEEQETLLVELEELERRLIIAKTSGEKQKIEREIRIINKKLVMISQRITKFESFIQIYKSKVTIRKYSYSIYRAIPLEIPVAPTEWLQLNSVISDMGTDVFKEKAALKVEEEIKRQYEWLWRWQIGSRLALFLWRWSKRKKMMINEMNNMANTAFQVDAAYATLNEQSQNAADRHWHELLTAMDAVNRITTVHNDHVDQLCKDYLNNLVNDAVFQQRFNALVAADTNIQNALNGQNITHIWTNILLQLKEQKALNTLINTLDTQLNSYITTGNTVYMHNMQNYIEQYIKDYQKLPAFRTTFEQFLQWDLNARNQLRRYLSHQKAIMNMQITNLTMNIDILNKGKSAYQIDNKDREKWWKYKVGHFLDKHPRWTAIGSVALWLWLWAATAPLSAVAWAAITTWVFGSYVWFTNYIKKWTHHTKEQNTHEKNVVTDYRNEQAKIQDWQNSALNGSWLKKYKAKRQLALYDQTTQENIKLSDQITEYITNLSAKIWPLTDNEDNFMRLNLIEWWARLKYYREIWHNFLASENVDKTEKDMRGLEKAITLWLQKIWQNTNDIENNMSATNGLGTNITYAVIQNDLKASYDKSLIQFKRERRNLALKYGISTATLSIGTALWLQWLTNSWVFAWKWTPPMAPTSTSHSWWTDNFALWKDEVLLPGELWYTTNPSGIHDATVSAISGAPNGSTVTFTYWVWTDATPVLTWHLTSADLGAKISNVHSSINGMSWLTGAQKASFLSELSKLSHSWFTNDNLASMRAAEYLEHCAQAMSDCWNSTLIPAFSRSLDVSGWAYNNWAERFMTWTIDITTPGKPWTNPVKRWRWLMWVPLFFNTFKKRKSTRDTTDQNFWQWNNQQRPQQPNQPQTNQNQPLNP